MKTTRERKSAKTRRTTFALRLNLCSAFVVSTANFPNSLAYRFILPYSRVYTFSVFCFVFCWVIFRCQFFFLFLFSVELVFFARRATFQFVLSPYSSAVLNADTRRISRSVDVALASATRVSFKYLVSLGLMLRIAIELCDWPIHGICFACFGPFIVYCAPESFRDSRKLL